MYDYYNSIGRLAGTISRKFNSLLQRELEENMLDVSVEEWSVLSHLYNNKNVDTQQKLVEVINRDKVAVKRLLDVLESKDYVKRVGEQDDKRCNQILITEKGKKVFEKGAQITGRINNLCLDSLTLDDKVLAYYLLDRISSNLKSFQE